MANSRAPLFLTLNPVNTVNTANTNKQLINTSTTNAQPLFKTAEVTGVVTVVNIPKQKGEPTTFKINCPNMNKTFDAVCDFYCPIRVGDTIYALCAIDANMKLHVTKSPFVQPCIDRNSIVQCFMRCLRLGFMPCTKLYNTISQIAGGDEQVISFLSAIAQLWSDTHNSEILFMFENTEPEDIKKLMGWWYRERNLRRLYLLGLTKKEINASRLTCDEIYERCTTNVYTIPAISPEKCLDILDRQNKKPVEDDVIRGSIMRTIWKSLHERGWSGMPTKFLSKQFPGIKHHVESLKADYGLVVELETAYLKHPHKVETWVADFIIEKCLSDKITYTTPIDEVIIAEDGTTINRLSAHFSTDVSEDQQIAIQGALDHKISIVTGAGGCGKCLGKGTEILMFDGTIKKVEDILVFDQVMGPDSLPRTIISTCTGTDNMFEIIPDKGRTFTCNTPHVLTLIGITPYITGNTVNYSLRGIRHIRAFTVEQDALDFIYSLEDDIFDIPLDEYMKLSEDDKCNCHVFHVGVTYPEHDVPVDPYTVGYELCDTDTCIPHIYKANSRHVRLQVLAGIINRSGNTNCIEITHKNTQVLKDIEYLAFSLGFMVTNSDNVINISGEHIEDIPLKSYYSSISRSRSRDRDRATCLNFKVNPLGIGTYYGFELSGDGRFLLGDFLVTHNTRVLGQIIYNLELRGITYAVCSFTGKAVAHIRKVTKRQNPSTMHRLIYNAKKDKLDKRSNQFEKDIPLSDYEHIVIDETSMVTTELLWEFLQVYSNVSKITFIGDVNQLQPIGWGCLFQQLLKSETIPTYKLTTNYRVYTKNGDRDGIVLNSNAIISHDMNYPFEFTHTDNFSVIEGPIERVYDIIRGCYSSGIKSDQIVILTPLNRSLNVLNYEFQKIYDEGARSVTDSRKMRWIVGDRVMLTENDKEIGVFNGETGSIKNISDKAILVDFGSSGCHEFLIEPTQMQRNYYGQGQSQVYMKSGNNADEVFDGDEGDSNNERTVLKLTLAFALSIDKSQGSEWDFVIVYIEEFNLGSFLNKNRMYTAITRGKRCNWIVASDVDALNTVAVKPSPFRCENLARRLTDKLPNIKPFKIASSMPLQEMNNDMKEEEMPQIFDTGFDCDDFD